MQTHNAFLRPWGNVNVAHGRGDHDSPSHVLILFLGERSGSQFVAGVACESIRQVVFAEVGCPLELRNEFVGDLRSDF